MVFILAEAGVNHNGSLELAYKLIDIAVESKADAIKFQTFKTESLVSYDAPKAIYQIQTNNKKETQFEMIKKLELSYDDFKKIFKRCKEKGITFVSSPFDIESVDFLANIGVSMFKVGSGELTNYLLLKRIAEKGKKIILSTGMSTLEEVKKSVNFIKKHGNSNIVLLHCVSSYPTRKEDLNLKCINTLKTELNLEVGFSDHTTDFNASIYSIAAGATYIEKHFTIDKNMEGPDHISSLNPEELNEFVKQLRDLEIIMGDGIKICKNNEENTRKVARKSLQYNKNLKKGHILKQDDLIALRPYNGICVSKYESLLGKKLINNVEEKSLIKWEDLDSSNKINNNINNKGFSYYSYPC
jgi:N,N'-diacetyllegionaminate synthase